MKGFLATTLAAVAAAGDVHVSVDAADVQFQADMETKRSIGSQVVDELVEDPYSLSGIMHFHGDHECMHAIGHDGTYHYIRMRPEGADAAMMQGDYVESTVMYGGKHLYVNRE